MQTIQDWGFIKGYKSITKEELLALDAAFLQGLSDSVAHLSQNMNCRVLGLTGPTCSGKTTAAKLLINHLTRAEKQVKTVSLDDFFKDSFSRKNLEGVDPTTLDFDSPDTLDTDLLDEFVETIFKEGKARKPIFNFVTGERDCWEEIVCDEDDVLLFEGIQVLYPKVYSIIESHGGAVLGVRPESAIVVGDKTFDPPFIRLCRRLVRDDLFRGATAEFTLGLWESVRRNEEENIFPHLPRCDVRIDTTLPYELNVLAPHLRRIFAEIKSTDSHYEEAMEILQMFDGIEGIDSAVIPEGSLYKEFV